MKLVTFTGKKGCGKSTAAKLLIENGFKEIKFADPLKNMLRAMYATVGVPEEEIERRIEGNLKEEPDAWLNGTTPRYAMQTLGTEWRKMISETLWSDMLYARAQGENALVCSDYRFPEETPAVRNLEGVIIKITRNEADKVEDSHSSENSFDLLPFDYLIPNNGTVDDLRKKIEMTLDYHYGKPYVYN